MDAPREGAWEFAFHCVPQGALWWQVQEMQHPFINSEITVSKIKMCLYFGKLSKSNILCMHL